MRESLIPNPQPLISNPQLQLQKACTLHGIVASTNPNDNYNRIWARDSVIAGLAGISLQDKIIIAGLRQSLITLQQGQADTGQLPSNVQFGKTISYGGLAGRVDATTWWIIGVCEYLKATNDSTNDSTNDDDSEDTTLPDHFYSSIKKAFTVLKAWEMNTQGLLYTPLGGNWADEYVTQGYTLYDNCLYLWALEAAAEVFGNKAYLKKSKTLRTLIESNFYLSESNGFPQPLGKDYHPTARKTALHKPPYWVAALAPNGYDTRFDMAGNALAEYLGIGTPETTNNLNNWLTERATAQNNWLLPVFYPIIQQKDPDWHLLHNNFAYNFKNYPYHFHNGGCWFVWLGFLGMALRKNGYIATAEHIANQIQESLSTENPPFTFYEYRATDTFECGGVPNLCFSAAGAVFSAAR